MKPYLYPQQELQRRALSWALHLKVNPAVGRIEAMKDKWGSCTSAGEITLAEDLVEMDERSRTTSSSMSYSMCGCPPTTSGSRLS